MTRTGREGEVSDADVLAAFGAPGTPSGPLTTADVEAALDGPSDAIGETLESLVERGELETRHVPADTTLWWRHTPTERVGDEATVPRGEYAFELEFRSTVFGDMLRGVAADHARDEFEILIDDDIPLDGNRLQYYTASGVDAAAYVAMLEEFETVENVRLLSVSGDSCRVEVELSAESMSGVLAAFGGRTKGGVYEHGIHHVLGELPADTDVDAVLAAVKSVYPHIEHHSTRRIISTRQFFRVAENALTDRQFTVLRMAYHGGYFEQPRESTGEELAARLGITKQTFNTHLRKAYQGLFEQLFREADRTNADQSA